jgi:hypothetical protein
MGSVPNWRLCQAPSDEPDTAHEVGVMPLRTAVTAMRVGRNGQGLSYLEETPIHVAMAWRFLEDAEGRRHNWWRLEVKSEPRDGCIRSGHQLVVAEHPYGNGWMQHASFKPGSKKGTLERADAADISFASVEEAAEWVGALNHDYWEKGCCLTAGISQPEIPFDPLEPVRNVQRSGLFVFGICEHLKEAERGLLRDLAIERLLEATERGTLRFWAPGAKLASVPTLLDEVKDDRWSLMGLSIRQALAGPHRHGARWIGHPVAEKVAQIYREHVNRRNRRLTEERARLAQLDEEARAVGPAQTHDTRMFH